MASSRKVKVTDNRVSTNPEAAAEPELTGQQLADLVALRQEELRVLHIRNIKANAHTVSFLKAELDTLMRHFEGTSNRAEIAADLLKDSGLSGTELEQFGMKLARIGLHK